MNSTYFNKLFFIVIALIIAVALGSVLMYANLKQEIAVLKNKGPLSYPRLEEKQNIVQFGKITSVEGSSFKIVELLALGKTGEQIFAVATDKNTSFLRLDKKAIAFTTLKTGDTLLVRGRINLSSPFAIQADSITLY